MAGNRIYIVPAHGLRINSVMNGIANIDGEYGEIIQKSDEYSVKLDSLNLPKEVWLLINRYISEQNAQT